MLRLSRISVPLGSGTSVAWWREASTSGMTMSLSVARPILIEPGGASAGLPGRRIFSMLVARLPSLERGAAVGPIAVTDSSAGCDIGRLPRRVGCAVLGGRRPPVTAAEGYARLRRPTGTGLGRGGGRRRTSCRRMSRRAAPSAAPASAMRRWAAPTGYRGRRRRRARRPLVAADLEGQPRAVGVADVDRLAVVDVDGGHPAAVDEHPVEAAVVDRDPAALVEPQHQVGARDQGVGDADVGAKVTADDDIVAGRERARRSVVPNGQRGRGWSAHRDQLYR